MFTGIVEEIGSVTRIQRKGKGFELTIRCRKVHQDGGLGDSIAVNGTCLTITHLTKDNFTVGLSPETRERTNLTLLREGDEVNLEASLQPSSRMGGHFVQGHVDGLGRMMARRPEEDSLWVTIGISKDLMAYIVPKGFVALDGASLTVVEVGEDQFSVNLVAYTQRHITLPQKKVGDKINVEVDILGKYVEKMLATRFGKDQKTGISLEFLSEYGYR
jgi:riboflavin synthase